ncbi:unnamed protein product [Toxocara canis]|uniref:CUB domain-containing protein n=1 Tax=Toxocara canis TaxID=6265 RepID=A0A183UF38_TOXCA|nr:unnamed protein product [Toxocara canis]
MRASVSCGCTFTFTNPGVLSETPGVLARTLAKQQYRQAMCLTADYFYMKDGNDLIVRLSGAAGSQYFSHNQLLWNRERPNKLPCIKGEADPAKELESHSLMSWSGDDIVTHQILMEDVESIGGVHFVAMSRELIEERADGWQKVAAISALCAVGGEIALFLATVAAVQFVAKPRIGRYKQELGIAHKKKQAIKRHAFKRLRKLRMRRLRARRRRLLRQRRRREGQRGSQSQSDESSSSSSSSFGPTPIVKRTTVRPSIGTDYDVNMAGRDEMRTNFKEREAPLAESSGKNVIDLTEGQQSYAFDMQRRFGVDRTNTQAPEPTDNDTGRTRGVNINSYQQEPK